MPNYSASFQSETYKDGTVVQPNETIEKKWLVKNAGEHQWPVGTRLVINEADPGNSFLIDIQNSPPVVRAEQGQSVWITLRFVLSEETIRAHPTGRFYCSYRLAYDDGAFGDY